MPRRKKHFLSLLEICIAIVLLVILLSFLWGMYRRWMVTYQSQQKQQMYIHKVLFLKQRLEQIATLIGESFPEEEEKNDLFTPKEKSEGFPTVCFSYQNAPDSEPSFNGRVSSLLYLDPHKRLCLATWGADKKTRVDVLLDLITSLSFSYFDPQTNLWREDWPDSLEHLPLWMQIKTSGEENIDLLFRLQHSLEPILYLEKRL